MKISPINYNPTNYSLGFEARKKNLLAKQYDFRSDEGAIGTPIAFRELNYTINPSDIIKVYSNLKKGQMVCSDGSTIFNRTTSNMFRLDIDWDEFGSYLAERFSDNNPINIYNWASSDGSEAFSLVILIKEFFKEKSKNFFPIHARDISKETIEKAKENQSKGEHTLNYKEWCWAKNQEFLEDDCIKVYLTQNKSKYFSQNPNSFVDYPVRLKPHILQEVDFDYGNILEDLDTIDENTPSIVMARNMWPYIKPEEYDSFAQALYQKLAKGSIVVIGYYDITGEVDNEINYKLKNSDKFPEALKSAGFTPAKTKIGTYKGCEDLIFEKN